MARRPGVRPDFVGDTVADVTTDMSADANDEELRLKINEILAVLRDQRFPDE